MAAKAHKELWQLSLTTTPEAEDAVTELLRARFGQSPISYHDLETRRLAVTVYFSSRPHWNATMRAELRSDLQRLTACGLDVGSGRLSLRRLRQQDWAESWKRHFRPLEIGGALLVKPSWSRRRARKNQAMIVLDPGLSFGTGQHPTTGFCLQQIVAGRPQREPRSFLDLGTGSGILAIAAAKLGYAPVAALDFDGEAVRVARANARTNGLSGKIQFRRCDVAGLPPRPRTTYSLVCANLTADLLLKHREHITRQVAANGVLVLAGILKAEFETVRRAYERANLRLLRSRIEKEWESAAFRNVLGKSSRL